MNQIGMSRGRIVSVPTITVEERLSETFAARASATRRAILARLAAGVATVDELAEPFDLTLPAVSEHIEVLERAGLVAQGRLSQHRPCPIDAAPLEQASSRAEHDRPIWEARLDRLDDHPARLRHEREAGCSHDG